MSCFSPEFVKELLIKLVVICVFIGIIRVLIPWLLGLFAAPPGGGIVWTIISYIFWGLVAVAVIYFCFALFECAFDGPGLRGLR